MELIKVVIIVTIACIVIYISRESKLHVRVVQHFYTHAILIYDLLFTHLQHDLGLRLLRGLRLAVLLTWKLTSANPSKETCISQFQIPAEQTFSAVTRGYKFYNLAPQTPFSRQTPFQVKQKMRRTRCLIQYHYTKQRN